MMHQDPLRLLVMPSYYPTPRLPLTGSFFREQSQVLATAADLRILVIQAQSTRRFLRHVPFSPDVQPLQDPPAWLLPYRKDKFMGWPRTMDSMSTAVAKGLAGFEAEGWIPDAILAHQFFWGGVLAARVGSALGIPVITVEHACPWLLSRFTLEQQAAIRRGIAETTTIGVVSPALRRLMLMHDLPRDLHWAVVGNLVDESVFHRVPKPRRSTRDELLIAAVANRTFKKDMETLFEAVALVRGRLSAHDVRVVAVGDFRGHGETLGVMAERAGVGSLIHTEFALDRKGVANLMQSADLFVSSSIAETFGIVMAEALACGTPVIATRSGGAEYILGDDSPFLVEVQDPAAMADKIADVAEGRLGFDAEAASADIVARFGREAFVDRMLGVIEEALERGPSAPAGG